MKIGFHGTSIQSATSIQTNGWKVPPNGLHWKQSTGNPYVLTDSSPDNLQECFRLAFIQASPVALKERHICKRAVLAIDLDYLKLKKDEHHHKDWAFEITNSDYFAYYKIVGIWVDEYDISDLKIFSDFINKTTPSFIPNTNNRTPMQTLLANSLTNYTMKPIKVPIVEKYRRQKLAWTPKEMEVSI